MTLDGRIERGLAAQLARRRSLLAAGAEPVGWKVGFNMAPVQERLGIDAPVAGYLTTNGLLVAGEDYALAGASVIAEPEVAIHLGADVTGGASREEAAGAIAGLGPAAELTDRPEALDDLEAILAGNVFHRAVLLGEPVAGARLDGVRARVLVNGEELGSSEAIAASGEPADVVLHVAGLLGAAGERLRAGERIIAGAMTPLVFPAPGDRMRLELGPLGSLELGFA